MSPDKLKSLVSELFGEVRSWRERMHRHPGSSGPSADPSRTFPGVKKPGHYGVARVTAKNLKVVKIDLESNLLLVKGAVPGPNGAFVTIRQSVKA